MKEIVLVVREGSGDVPVVFFGVLPVPVAMILDIFV